MTDKFSLECAKANDKTIWLQFYKWQITETKKETMCCTFLPKQQTQSFKEENFQRFWSSIESYLKSGVVYAFLKNIETNELLGWINYSKYNQRNFSIEISYYFPQENRKKGFGKKIFSKFLEMMFNNEKMNINKIYAETYAGNVGSKKLLEQFGFHLDGKMREHYWFEDGKIKYDQLIYSILRKDWK